MVTDGALTPLQIIRAIRGQSLVLSPWRCISLRSRLVLNLIRFRSYLSAIQDRIIACRSGWLTKGMTDEFCCSSSSSKSTRTSSAGICDFGKEPDRHGIISCLSGSLTKRAWGGLVAQASALAVPQRLWLALRAGKLEACATALTALLATNRIGMESFHAYPVD